MRQTLITLLTLCTVTAGAPAGAQTLPDQIRAAVRDGVTRVAYQQGREEQTERQTKTVRIGTNGELSLANIAGDIVVTRANGGDATIDIVKTARARTADDARQMLGLVTVTVTERNGRAEVKTEYPRDDSMRRENRRNVNVSVAYTVSAPAGTRLTIGSVSGSVKVSDIKGDLAINSISGTVRIANGGRIASAKSVSGAVEISDTQLEGALEAQSISGDVSLRRVTARRASLGTVSGSVKVQDLQCDRVEAHSISGTVEYGGALSKGGRYELSSHSGDVRVALAGDTGFELEAKSFSGSVNSDLRLTLQESGGDNRRGPRRTAIRGVFGDGSAVLDVTTFSGSVVITRR